MTISKTTALLQVADALEALSEALRALSGEVPGPEQQPERASSKAEPGPAAEPDAPTLEQVRAVLAKLSRKGATDEVRDLLADLGCSRLSEVPAEKYPEVLERAKSIQRSYR